MQGGVTSSNEEKTRVLTAYVLVAMLESFKMMRERTPVSTYAVKIVGSNEGSNGSNKEKSRVLTAYVLVAMLESFKTTRERTPMST